MVVGELILTELQKKRGGERANHFANKHRAFPSAVRRDMFIETNPKKFQAPAERHILNLTTRDMPLRWSLADRWDFKL